MDVRGAERLPKDVQPISHEYPLFRNYHARRGDQVLGAVTDAILTGKPYPVKALIIQGANPVVTMANSKKIIQAMKRLDLIVVMDLFMTRTAKLAHIVLPATTSFEKTQLNLKSMSGNRVVLQNQTVSWYEESWPDWKIIFELAKTMGYTREFPWSNVEEAIDDQLEPAGITVEMLRQNPDGVVFEENRYEKYRTQGFATTSGKIEIYSETFREYGYPPIPDFDEGAENKLSFFDQRESYPFIAISGARSKNFVHSQFRNIPALLQREPEPFVDIHPEDARELEIRNGDEVSIETPNDRLRMKAKISRAVHPGCIRIPWGWGEYNPEYNLNNLTEDWHRDPICSATSNRSFMCRVSKTD